MKLFQALKIRSLITLKFCKKLASAKKNLQKL